MKHIRNAEFVTEMNMEELAETLIWLCEVESEISELAHTVISQIKKGS